MVAKSDYRPIPSEINMEVLLGRMKRARYDAERDSFFNGKTEYKRVFTNDICRSDILMFKKDHKPWIYGSTANYPGTDLLCYGHKGRALRKKLKPKTIVSREKTRR